MTTQVDRRTTADGELGPGVLVALGLLTAAGPLAMDFYLASLPAVQASLHASATATQLTVTGFLVGLGAGQLVWGPVSDRFGRRLPIVLGSSVSVLASVAAVAAPNVWFLIVARFAQAFAASACVVIARAVVADRLRGSQAARAMSLIMTINYIAPVVAPLVGGVLASAGVSWRVVLAVVLGAMAAQLLTAIFVIEESLPRSRRHRTVQFVHLTRLFGRPVFVGYALTSMFGYGVLMAYISSSSFIYQRVMGASGALFGVGFAVNAGGMIVAGLLSARLIRRGVRPASLVAGSLPVLVAASALVLVIAASPLAKPLLVVPFLLMQTALGFVLGNSAALAIDAAREVAGSASGVLGALNFLFGGALSALSGVAGGATAVPAGVVMVVSAAGALASYVLVRRRSARS